MESAETGPDAKGTEAEKRPRLASGVLGFKGLTSNPAIPSFAYMLNG